jgi:hypothetical protein
MYWQSFRSTEEPRVVGLRGFSKLDPKQKSKMSKEQSPAERKANQHFRKEAQAREGLAAWVEYNAQEDATRQKIARLRELRLARDAAAAIKNDGATPKVTPTRSASAKSRKLR